MCFLKKKLCSNCQVEPLTQGLWGSALDYERFLFRKVIIPKILFRRVIILKIFIPKGHYSERFLSRRVIIPKLGIMTLQNKNLWNNDPSG